MSRPATPKKDWLTHYGDLIRSWTKTTRNPHDAEDALQDIAEKMIGIDIAAIHHPRAYLQRSAINGMTGRQYAHADSLIPLDELPEDAHPTTGDVETAVYVSQMSEALSAALSTLPAQCQQVFAWHRLEHWTVPEIARHMDISVSSVEKYLTRTMRHLQKELQRFAS